MQQVGGGVVCERERFERQEAEGGGEKDGGPQGFAQGVQDGG